MILHPFFPEPKIKLTNQHCIAWQNMCLLTMPSAEKIWKCMQIYPCNLLLSFFKPWCNKLLWRANISKQLPSTLPRANHSSDFHPFRQWQGFLKYETHRSGNAWSCIPVPCVLRAGYNVINMILYSTCSVIKLDWHGRLINIFTQLTAIWLNNTFREVCICLQ